VEQRGKRDLFDVQVVPFARPFVSVMRSPLDPSDDLQYAKQGLWFVLEQRFDRERRFKAGEKRLEAIHHHGVVDCRNVCPQALAAVRLYMRQNTNRHQGILKNDRRDIATIDLVDVLPRFFESACSLPKNRHLGVTEKVHPSIEIGKRLIEHAPEVIKLL
jgi:hypothetical protein